MTPDERDLLNRFLQDLTQARPGPKDPDAADLIARTLNGNADAQYLLVQHAILSDQALHAAQARIADLESQARPAPAPSFLGGGSGPWRQPQPGPAPAYPDQYPTGPFAQGPSSVGPFSSGGGLGSFLRGAATTAAGVAGGEMLFEGLSGMFGGHRGLFGGGGGFGGGENITTVNNYYDDDRSSDDRSSSDDDYDDDSSFDDS
jgi:uncharacterized protein